MIKNWLEENNILFTELSSNNIEIQGLGDCLVVSEKDITLDESLTLILDEQEELQKPDNYIFKWGDNYYYSPTIKVKQFDILKYVGEFDDKIGITNYQFLGVHGGYEILNGSRSYKDWVKKAKFIGVRTLGICEKNTLAGTIKFQLECENGQINSVIGEEVTVKDGQEFYQIKLFVKNSKGWKDLLHINYEINVLNPGKYIELIKLHNFLSNGNLIIIFDPKYITLDQTLGFQLQQDSIDLYYQIDTVIYENEEREEWYLNNLKGFIIGEHFKPILLSDAYYLDKEDFKAKQILNSISNLRDYKSKNQYFKNLYEEFEILNPLFKDEDKFFEIFQESIENLAEIEDKCIRFKIQTKVWHLPIYKQDEEQLKQYKGNNKDLFLDLITDGLKRKSPEGKFEEYKARLEKEYPVIVDNGFIDYFLILWGIVKWAKSQGILTGVARGSAGGSIISYFLDVTELDPIKFDLLFERFLNEDRAKVSVPDIDTDFQASRRDEVKQYMENKYGINQVCSVGTYTNLKLRAAFKDIARQHNIPFEISNYITQELELETNRWFDLFKTATKNKRVKDFIFDNPGIIEDIKLILNQPKSRSIHACATLILPDEKPIYEWIPIRKEIKNDEEIIVSEWEGIELETAGFLKEDILGIKQLDKYAFILDLIYKAYGIKIDLNTISLEDERVYELFKNGYNGDVFHFGSMGLTQYCKELRPDNIEDLIAAISLYRPGAIENRFHEIYIDRKEGRSEVEYWVGAEKVLNKTHAVVCLSGDSNILTKNGIKNIKNIEIGDLVLTEDGSYQKVLNYRNNGLRDTIRIRCNFGEELVLTEDHKLLTQRGWLQAKDLTNKDLIKSFWLSNKKIDSELSEKDELEHWLIGYFIAEGSSDSTPYFTVGSMGIINKLKKIILKVIPDSLFTVRKNSNGSGGISYSLSIKYSEGNNGSFSKNFKENKFNNLLKKYNIYGMNCYNKRLPNNYSIHMISGLIEGDGCLYNSTLRMCNNKLVYDVFIALQSYRIFSYYRGFELGYNDENNLLKFRILVDRKLSPSVRRYIPVNQINMDLNGLTRDERNNYFIPSKRDKAFMSTNVLKKFSNNIISVKHDLWAKVLSIYKDNNQEVFDLEIDKVHSFVSGGLVVHNCYQEQVMQLCQVLGGLSLVEADDVRRAMVKKKYEALHQYKERFIPYYIENFGVSEEYATGVWESIDKASLYLFNRSHAAAYAITGYMGQWLKSKYPLQYWTAAFQFDDEDPKKSSISRYMNEIKHTDDFIKIMPPNINKSGETFTSDSEKFELYWSIGRVKQVGEKALQGIIEERERNGEFFSFEEFLSRVEKRVVNKAVVINLILSGAFDELENISFVSSRRNIIHKYFEFMGTMKDLPEEYKVQHEDYWWQIKQKEISGFGIIDYEKVIRDKTDFNISKFVDADGLKSKNPNSSVVIAGLISKCDIRKTKNKDEYCRIILDCNNQEISLIIWNDFFSQLDREDFYNRIIIFEGVVIKDSYKKAYEDGGDHVVHSCEDSKIYFV